RWAHHFRRSLWRCVPLGGRRGTRDAVQPLCHCHRPDADAFRPFPGGRGQPRESEDQPLPAGSGDPEHMPGPQHADH
ncbi:unnamed protein product, partial [Effrenium voratum]